MKLRMKRLFYLAMILCLLTQLHSRAANAGTLSTWTWTDTINSQSVSGTATFSTISVGTNQYDLVIKLENDATAYPSNTADILTALVFNISSGAPASGLTLVSAYATDGLLSGSTNPQTTADAGSAGASICGPAEALNTCSNHVLGGWEAAYSATGLTGGTNWADTAEYGIGTAGLGIFNAGDTGSSGQSDYGIAPAVGINGQDGVYGQLPFTLYLDTFTLSGLTTPNPTISDVIAAYGTTPEGSPYGTTNSPGGGDAPEPAPFITFLTGCLLLAFARRWHLAK